MGSRKVYYLVLSFYSEIICLTCMLLIIKRFDGLKAVINNLCEFKF